MHIMMSCPCGHQSVFEQRWAEALWEQGQMWRRCPDCGTPLYQTGNHFEVWRHTMPVAVGLLVCTGTRVQDRVLAVARKDDPGAFGIPGGKVDPEDGFLTADSFMETIARATAREVREETGIDLPLGDFRICYEGVCAPPWGGLGQSYWMVTLSHPDAEGVVFASQPGEGVVAWVPWAKLEAGPFGEYNRKLREHLR